MLPEGEAPAGPFFVAARSALVVTVAFDVELLFPPFGSFAVVTVAVFEIVEPETAAFAT
jgi:hypothetical protein